MDVGGWCKIVIACVGELPEVFPPAMVVLQADCGSVMCAREGPIDEVCGFLFG